MSKITNDSLTRSGTGCFIASCTHMATVGVKGLSHLFIVLCLSSQPSPPTGRCTPRPPRVDSSHRLSVVRPLSSSYDCYDSQTDCKLPQHDDCLLSRLFPSSPSPSSAAKPSPQQERYQSISRRYHMCTSSTEIPTDWPSDRTDTCA